MWYPKLQELTSGPKIMHESALTPRKKEEEESKDNEANNEKIIVWSDHDTQNYTLGGQSIMV